MNFKKIKRPEIRILPEWSINLDRIKCKLFGHKWKMNFTSMGDRVICDRCNKKMELDLHSLEWKEVEKFRTNIGTDEEIKKRWIDVEF